VELVKLGTVLIDTQEYWCIDDILPPKKMYSESRDLFKFWETSDNISHIQGTRKVSNSKSDLHDHARAWCHSIGD